MKKYIKERTDYAKLQSKTHYRFLSYKELQKKNEKIYKRMNRLCEIAEQKKTEVTIITQLPEIEGL